MGAAGSALPEKLSEAELRNLCKDKFDQKQYDAVKDSEGNVSRDQFMVIAQKISGEENEVHELFKAFCPDGGMNSKNFVKLCKDSKLLNKKKFTSTDCDLIFSKAKNHQGTNANVISYDTFRGFVVAAMAQRMDTTEEKLISKLARSEGPILTGTRADKVAFHDDKSTFTGAHAQGGPSIGKNDTGGVTMENLLDRKEGDVRGRAMAPADEAQVKAALKLQTASRTKVAMKRVQSLKEIKAVEQLDNVAEHFDTNANNDDEGEMRLRQVFQKYCEKTHGEMDSKTFSKMLKDTNVITRKFTSGDADLVFQKTKAMASAPSAGSYSSGVVHGKRVNYEVFRAVAVPNLATKTGTAIPALVAQLGSVDGPVLTNVTTAQSNKFHDDPSTYTGTHTQGHA